MKEFYYVEYEHNAVLGLLCLWQVEKQRADLTAELDDLTDRLEEAGGVTTAQVKKYLTLSNGNKIYNSESSKFRNYYGSLLFNPW